MEAGNDVSALVAAFEEVRDIDHPVVVHIHTLKGAGYDGEETHADRQTASASPVSFDSPTGVHPTDNVNHSEPWHSDHCNLSDHERMRASARPRIGRIRMPQSASRTIRASITANGDGRTRTAFRPPSPGTRGHLPATPGSNGITHESESARAHIM